MTGKSPAEIAEALAGITDALRLDGYELEVVDASDTLSLKIHALEGACADCLVGEQVMTQIVSGAVKGAYPPERITVAYPAGSPH